MITRSLLAAAGFGAQMEELEQNWLFEDFGAYWTFLTELAGAISVAIAALPDEDQRALRDESRKPWTLPLERRL